MLSSTQVPVQASDDDPRVGGLMCMRWQVRRVVADGGMGRVYEALDMQAPRQQGARIEPQVDAAQAHARSVRVPIAEIADPRIAQEPSLHRADGDDAAGQGLRRRRNDSQSAFGGDRKSVV